MYKKHPNLRIENVQVVAKNWFRTENRLTPTEGCGGFERDGGWPMGAARLGGLVGARCASGRGGVECAVSVSLVVQVSNHTFSRH